MGDKSIYNGTHTEEYKGPAPPAGSDPHRYCQFLFETEERIDWPARPDPTNRTNFETQKFMDTVMKTKGGRLEASTYFMAQHERGNVEGCSCCENQRALFDPHGNGSLTTVSVNVMVSCIYILGCV